MTSERADFPEAPDADYVRVLNSIDQLAELQPGWNSYHADQINEYARERAKRLVRSFLTHYPPVPIPRVAPTPNGGVLLHWDAGKLEVEITFDPIGGTYSVAQVDSPEFPVYGDNLGEGIDGYKKIIDPYLFRR